MAYDCVIIIILLSRALIDLPTKGTGHRTIVGFNSVPWNTYKIQYIFVYAQWIRLYHTGKTFLIFVFVRVKTFKNLMTWYLYTPFSNLHNTIKPYPRVFRCLKYRPDHGRWISNVSGIPAIFTFSWFFKI